MRALVQLVLLAVLLHAAIGGRARAQEQGAPLAGESFTIDLVTGPVVASGRIIGLGGAYTALAYGADGAAWTPATYATRTMWELSWFDWDLAFDYSPALFRNSDFDNNGQSAVKYGDLLFATVGGRFTFGEFGFGGLVRLQEYDVGPRANLSLLTANYGVAHAFLAGQLMVGVGARTAVLTMRDRTTDATLVDFDGTGPEIGAVLGPAEQPFRIGLAARLAVESTKTSSARVAAGLTLPTKLVLPSELQLGLAYQLGPRPMNRRFVNPNDVELELRKRMLARRAERQQKQSLREAEDRRLRESIESGPPHAHLQEPADPTLLPPPRDREFWAEEWRIRWNEERALLAEIDAARVARVEAVKALPRQYLLLSADVIFTGRTEDGVGLESFLTQTRQTSGDDVSLGVRFGVEGEPIERRLKARLGTYFEPSRFSGVPYRVHGTSSIELRLFRWNLFGLLDPFELRVGAYVDIAERYNNFGVGIGVWH